MKKIYSIITLLLLMFFMPKTAEAQYAVRVEMWEHYYPGCGDNDPVFSVQGYNYRIASWSSTDWYTGGNTGTINSRNQINCGDTRIFTDCDYDRNYFDVYYDVSDEDHWTSYYCDHNSNSCNADGRQETIYFAGDEGVWQYHWTGADNLSNQIRPRYLWAYGRNELDWGDNEFVGYYYDGTNFNNYVGFLPLNNDQFDQSWGASDWINTLCGDVHAETFSIRYRMRKDFGCGGTYNFTIGSDDGTRLYIDGALVIDNWRDQGYTTASASRILSSGTHDIEVQYYENGGGNRASFSYSLISAAPAPSNDACTGAETIAIGGVKNGNTSCYNSDSAPTCGTGDGTGGGAWYKVVGDGANLRASLCNSNFDTKIRVYSGSCGALSCIVGTDDGGCTGTVSEVDWCTTNGTTYYILVHGYGSSEGNYELQIIDQGGPTTYYADGDADGYGNPASSITTCAGQPAGYVTNNTDCNDSRGDINPGHPEVCNGFDNNCNGMGDEPYTTYYQDNDGDGFGNSSVSQQACSAPLGYVVASGDCNDNDANTYPGTIPGSPSNFGNNVWNVYAFNAGDANGNNNAWNNSYYQGYYTKTDLDFISDGGNNSWGSNFSPSYAASYTGCPIPVDNHSFKAKRRGFECGVYQIDIPSHDDEAQLWVNGVRVFYLDNVCCQSHTNVWTGYLDGTSEVEFWISEGGGGSQGSLDLTKISSISATYNVTPPNDCSTDGSIIVNTPTSNSYNIINSNMDGAITGSAISGSSVYSGGYLQLTPNSNSAWGAYEIYNTSNLANPAFEASFNFRIWDGSGGADGLSFNFGDFTLPSAYDAYEHGLGNKLTVKIISYSGANPRIALEYNDVELQVNYSFTERSPNYQNMIVRVDHAGRATVTIGASTVFSNYQLPAAYISADKSNWKFGFGARTGGANDNHRIDNLSISVEGEYEYSINNGATWQSSPAFTGLGFGTYDIYAQIAGGDCQFYLGTQTFTDNTAPSITCPANIVTATDEGTCVATVVNLGTPSVFDACGITSTTNNAPSSFPLGNTSFTWTTTDNYGNSNSCTQMVTVEDNITTALAGSDQLLCEEANAIMAANSPGIGETGVWNWSPNTVNYISGNASTPNAVVSFPSIGTYIATWTISSCPGYTSSDNVEIIVQGSQAATSWTGAEDDNWHNAMNWSNCVPSSNTDVTLPVGLATYPVIYANGQHGSDGLGHCHSILLESGATLVIKSSARLNVAEQ